MKRRYFLIASSALAAPFAMADTPKVQSLDDAMRWLDRLDKFPTAKTTGTWPLSSVLEHMGQSVEMSMDGFPQTKSALFQRSAGSAAFSFFKWRGQMTHSLSEPIPGAPALGISADWHPASARLRAAIVRFNQHQGALRPHFAYGALDKRDFALAHALHIANHQDEILIA